MVADDLGGYSRSPQLPREATMGSETEEPDDASPPKDAGFSTAEKAVGVWAAYEHPVASAVVANHMLGSETDPTRRRQLTTWRNNSVVWICVGVAVAIIGLVVVLSFASSHGLVGDSCRGGPDKTDPMNTTYDSSDGKHWTATYPCVNGGSTTVPVPRRLVPGGG
jgi:hypothetical protein